MIGGSNACASIPLSPVGGQSFTALSSIGGQLSTCQTDTRLFYAVVPRRRGNTAVRGERPFPWPQPAAQSSAHPLSPRELRPLKPRAGTLSLRESAPDGAAALAGSRAFRARRSALAGRSQAQPRVFPTVRDESGAASRARCAQSFRATALRPRSAFALLSQSAKGRALIEKGGGSTLCVHSPIALSA